MKLNADTIRLTDETIREGESRGFHPHTPIERADLVQRIHEVTGIRHFGVPDWTGNDVLSEPDRATVAELFRRRGRGIPEDISIRLIGSCGWDNDRKALAYIEALPADQRSRIGLVYVITGASEAIVRPQEGAWVIGQAGGDWRSAPREEVFEAVGAATLAGLRMFDGAGIEEVVLGIGDAFRADIANVERFVDVGLAADVDGFQLFDTIGVAYPVDVAARIRRVVSRARGKPVRVHFHNDFGMAVANTLTALASGAVGADVTVNGVGNRAGNGNLAEIVMALRCIHDAALSGMRYDRLRDLSRYAEDYFGVVQSTYAPITGRQISVLQASIERTHIIETIGARDSYIAYEPEFTGDSLQAAHGPASGVECVEDVLGRHADRLASHGIEPSPALVERAFAWVERERAARAAEHKPRALAAIEAYERELRASYVTDDDIIDRAIATGGRFDRTEPHADGDAPVPDGARKRDESAVHPV